MAVIDTLIEMGFDKWRIERAIKAVGDDNNIDIVLNWMDQNEQLLDEFAIQGINEEPKPGCSYADSIPENAANLTKDVSETAATSLTRNILCDDCGKILRPEEIEFHALKTSHENYRESSEEVKSMTEEEKQQALKKAESLIKQRRVTQAEKKRRDEIEYERNRRKVGQELASVRQRIEEQERKQAIEARKKEKQEANSNRLRVLQDIERDKLERQERFRMQTCGLGISDIRQQALEVGSSPPAQQVAHAKCQLQIRLTNGDCLVETFNATEELSAVRLFVQLNRTDEPGSFNLRTIFPCHRFQEHEMSSTLNSLGLCPKSVILVTKGFPSQAGGDFK